MNRVNEFSNNPFKEDLIHNMNLKAKLNETRDIKTIGIYIKSKVTQVLPIKALVWVV